MEPPKDNIPIFVTPIVLNPLIDTWDRVAQDILKIEKAAFGEEEAFEDERSQKLYSNPKNTYVLLRDNSGAAIGYTCATRIYDDEVPDHHNPQNRLDDKETAYIMSTGILPEHQGERLVVPLLNALEEELRKRGYKFVERDAAISNGYAESLLKANKDRVIEWYDRVDPVYGPQRYFRMRL